MYKGVVNLFFSPVLVALALSGFSVYLVAKGETEAAMGGAGAAIAAATMRRNEDSEEDSETRLQDKLKIQQLEIELKYRSILEIKNIENMELKFSLQMKEQENLVALTKQDVNHKLELLIKDQENRSQKALPEEKKIELEAP